jgi:glycine cleavage system H lipoate-binding protein
VVTLVFVTVLLAACALDWWLIRPWEARHRPGRPARDDEPLEFVVPRTLFFHPGHTWARLESDGQVTVGVDDLARTAIGDVENIELPAVGDRLEAGRPAIAVQLAAGKLSLAAPVSGTVTEVNRVLGTDPVRLRWRPYKEGWAFRLAPGDNLAGELGRLKIGRDAERWMRHELDRLNRLIAVGILELPFEGALQRAGDDARRRVSRELFRVEPGGEGLPS